MEKESGKGIVAGLPVLYDHDTVTPANWVSGIMLDLYVTLFGWNGWVMPYEGSYLRALWDWIRLSDEDQG